MKIAVFGAGGRSGQALVEAAVKRGHGVIAAEHDWPFETPAASAIERRTADVMTDNLETIIEGTDTVISALSLGLSAETIFDPPPLYTEGTLRITEAMQSTGVKRLLVISATFVESRDIGPLWFQMTARNALANIYRQMGDMERVLRAQSGLEWTAARAGWLLDRPFTGDYTVQENRIADGTLRTRCEDLADFMIREAEQGDWICKTPAISRKEARHLESPPALLEELR
ncbi:MAG: NAD(P)H-binding protein [Pacificimonas sp.]|jgi:putative NADH-flavin reductase|nr:NAD(P)H-binding protein [Pacificimonas sp.]